MSPMPRLGRKASTLILTALLILAAALTILSPAGAQGDENATGADGNETGTGANDTAADGNATGDAGTGTDGAGTGTDGGQTGGQGGGDGDVIPRKYTVRALDTGCPDGADPCWDLATLPVLAGDVVEVTVDLTPSAQPHNFHVVDPIGQMTATETGTVQTLSFTIPDNFGSDERIEYVCDVHPTTMVGFFVGPDALGAAEEHEAVPQMGVNFLAYWVGVIAFALLFIVYGATFFLFKYNETPATTDHFDRGRGEGSKLETRNAVILAVLFAVVATAALVYVLS